MSRAVNGEFRTEAEYLQAQNGASELREFLDRPMGQIAMQDGQMVPTDFEGVERIATWLFQAGVAPKSVQNVAQCMAIIAYGMSIGFTALQSLRWIMLVNGVPTVWGDGALALVRKSPLCTGVREWFDQDADPEKIKANCEVKRATRLPDGTYREETISYSFSVADAKKAGLWGKSGPWSQHPKRMLKYRARAFCLRDSFPDVLGGLYITEEFDGDETPPEVAPSPPKATARGAAGLVSRLEASKTEAPRAEEPGAPEFEAEPPEVEQPEPATVEASTQSKPATRRGSKPGPLTEGDLAF